MYSTCTVHVVVSYTLNYIIIIHVHVLYVHVHVPSSFGLESTTMTLNFIPCLCASTSDLVTIEELRIKEEPVIL